MTLEEMLRKLGLSVTAKELNDIIAHATKKKVGPAEFLEGIANKELNDRAEKSLQRRLTVSKIGRFAPISNFDWEWPKKIQRELVEQALQLHFLEKARNIILVAPHGLGKTMIAKNIAHNAILKGHAVVFLTASELLMDLEERDSTKQLEARLKYYQKIGLLIIDELGYVSYHDRAADLLFQIVTRRYENKSLIITTNQPFSAWPSVFPNATSATALVDRLIHHADIISMEGDSYRRREAEEHAKPKKPRS